MGEKWPVISTESCDFHAYILHAANMRYGTNGLTSLPKEVMLKNPTASAGFEPANLGTKGQHATSRPPKPLYLGEEWLTTINGSDHYVSRIHNLQSLLCYLVALSWYTYVSGYDTNGFRVLH